MTGILYLREMCIEPEMTRQSQGAKVEFMELKRPLKKPSGTLLTGFRAALTGEEGKLLTSIHMKLRLFWEHQEETNSFESTGILGEV